MSKQLSKARYLSGLLGRKRAVISSEVDDIEEPKLDILVKMIANQLDLSEELLTETIEAQTEVEESIKQIYEDILASGELPTLLKDKHTSFLSMALGSLPSMFKVLDASQPWILYWVLNSMNILGGAEIPLDLRKEIGLKVLSFIHPDGGIGGGIGQFGHVAATYAGINTLVLIQDEDIWAKLDRRSFYRWLLTLKQDDGSFVMHVGGEKDTRAVYCALSIASLLDILTPELVSGTAEWLQQCQTFEGGFGGVPFDEAHGGYTFCAVAALLILGKSTFLNHTRVDKLLQWVSSRQLPLEGGFSGRSNKLVDGCYSFWVGGVVPIFDIILEDSQEVISREALGQYILGCCQNDKFGGLRDKPGKHADYYHSNYVLLGLSIVQNKFHAAETFEANGMDSFVYSISSTPIESETEVAANIVSPINPVFALPAHFAERFKKHWRK